MFEEYQLAVKKGAYWLDEVYPSWFEAINLESLDLSTANSCVLGQLVSKDDPDCFGFFTMTKWLAEGIANSKSEYKSPLYQRHVVDEFMHDNGFNINEDVALDDIDEESVFGMLTDLWAQEVERRTDG